MKTFTSAALAFVAIVLPLSVTASPVGGSSGLQARAIPACCPEAQNAARIGDQTALNNAFRACAARGCRKLKVRDDCVEATNAEAAGDQTALKNALAACAARGASPGGSGAAATPAANATPAAAASGDGCLPRSDCGPASQFYQPGCPCENTLFTKRDAAPEPVAPGCFECGPSSQFYKPGCHCENTLFVN